MAWYSGARKLELQPESDAQAAIIPTQFILHSIAAPWTVQRIYEFWRDSTNLESHFGLSYDGDLGQFIGTETKADANFNANRRPDGTGAVSIETASNLQHTDPWTDAQIEKLIELGAWLHQRHAIPLRKCREADDPGYGYHRMYADWSSGGTACPGDARVEQFHDVVFPGIVNRVNGEVKMTPEQDLRLKGVETAVKDMKVQIAKMITNQALAPWTYKNVNLDPRDMRQFVADIDANVKSIGGAGITPAQMDLLAEKVADLLADRLAD